jgi:hypothetical protein
MTKTKKKTNMKALLNTIGACYLCLAYYQCFRGENIGGEVMDILVQTVD